MNEYKVGDILLTNEGEFDWDDEYKYTLIVVRGIDSYHDCVIYDYINARDAIAFNRTLYDFNNIIYSKIGEVTWHIFILYFGFFLFTDSLA